MKFTIITVNYNNSLGLSQTIGSLIDQTYKDFEYIIIDGGSTDGSVDIIRESEKHISYWISEKDNGIYHAMNKGIAQAHGDYCLFLNSGDYLYDKSVLEHISEVISDEDILVGRIYSKDGRNIFLPPTREISFYYLYSATIPHQSSFIKTVLLKQYPYDENMKIVSDWKFFLEAVILHNCSVKFVDVNVTIFDVEGVSTSNPQKMWEEKQQVLNELFPSRVLKDYQQMKSSECLTQNITPLLKKYYCIDRILYFLGVFLLKFRKK